MELGPTLRIILFQMVRLAPKRASAVPLFLLFAAAVLFFARVLFTSQYTIPWDFRAFHLPLATLLLNAMRGTGSVLWDTSTYCGRPLFADPQAQVFYPPTDLAVFVARVIGPSWLTGVLEWELAIHVFLAGAFTYSLLRRMGLSPPAALCGGLVFELGGFFASQTQHFGAIAGAAWMPLLWKSAWELCSTASKRSFFILAFACSMSILAGFPAITAVAIVSTFVLATSLWLPKRMPLVAAALVLGCGLSAVMLVPAAELTLASVAKYRSDWFDGHGLPVKTLITLVWPPGREAVSDLLYCGIAGVTLGLIGAWAVRRRREALPLLLVTVASGIWMLGTATPVGRAIWTLTPNLLKGSLYPQYAMAPFCLGVATLAGFGLDHLRQLSTRHKYALSALVAIDLIATGSGRPMNTNDLRLEPGITSEAIDGSRTTLARLRSLVNSDPRFRADTHGMAAQWCTTAPLTRIPIAGGYNPLVLERLIQARLSFAKGDRWGALYQVEDLNSPMIDALSVRYLLSGSQIATTAKFTLLAEFPGFWIYENSGALPRYFLVHQVRLARSLEESAREIHRPDFEPSQYAVVEAADADPAIQALQTGAAPVPSHPEEGITVRRYGPREVELAVDSAGAGFLVTSEAQYPEWRAWVDGAEVPILITNGAFRGLAIPPGQHAVRFRFVPRSLYVGAVVSALSWCVVLFVFGRRPRTTRI